MKLKSDGTFDFSDMIDFGAPAPTVAAIVAAPLAPVPEMHSADPAALAATPDILTETISTADYNALAAATGMPVTDPANVPEGPKIGYLIVSYP